MASLGVEKQPQGGVAGYKFRNGVRFSVVASMSVSIIRLDLVHRSDICQALTLEDLCFVFVFFFCCVMLGSSTRTLAHLGELHSFSSA